MVYLPTFTRKINPQSGQISIIPKPEGDFGGIFLLNHHFKVASAGTGRYHVPHAPWILCDWHWN